MIGTHLGDYLIERELGAGGMGTVYKAVGPDGPVALKVFHPHLLRNSTSLERFRREAELGRRIDHPNVVRTLGAGKSDDHAYLVVEYVEGQTLRALLAELGSVPEELCRHIAVEVARGLASVHDAGILHRDLKPENVLITGSHAVKLMDLGVARLQDESARLSEEHAFVGSIDYAAPEQLGEGSEPDARTDLFAFGVLLYELASGQHPFRRATVSETMGAILRAEPRRLGKVVPQLSPLFEEAVHTLLERRPTDRFPEAARIADVFADGESGQWWLGRAESMRRIRRPRIPRETALYGREEPIERLDGLFAAARSGEGRLLLIEGEAGIGKTRLVDEFIQRLQQEEDLHFLLGSYAPGSISLGGEGIAAAFRDQLGPRGSTEYLSDAPALAAAFDEFLRIGVAPEGPLSIDALRTCFVRTLQGLAAERPTVVLIDDLHFASDEARKLFGMLARAITNDRVLLIGTTRPGEHAAELDTLLQVEHGGKLWLDRLAADDIMRLVHESLGSDRLASAITEKSDGNPFFAFEIIEALRQSGRTSAGSLSEIEIPSSVIDLIETRVSQLARDERELLDLAACWGFEFDPTLIAGAAGRNVIEVLQTLGHIERTHRLVRSAGRDLRFDHHQVQEVLYAKQPQRLREAYHAALASTLEGRGEEERYAVELAEQFLLGGQGRRALPYIDTALERLERGYRNDQAVSLYEAVLGEPGLVEGQKRAKYLLGLEGRLRMLADWERHEQVCEEAMRVAEEPATRAAAMGALGAALSRQSRLVESEQTLQRAWEAAREAGDEAVECSILTSLCATSFRLGHLDATHELYDRAIVLARESGDTIAELNLTGNRGGALYSAGRFDEALEHFETALAMAIEHGHRGREAVGRGNLGAVLQSRGRYAESRAHLEQALQLSREVGNRQGEANVTLNLGAAYSGLGNQDEARRCFELARTLGREVGERLVEANATGNLGNSYLTEGRLAEGYELFVRRLEIFREHDAPEGQIMALVNLGILEQRLGDHESTRARLDEATAIAEKYEIGRWAGWTFLQYGELAAEEGKPQEALEWMERALADHREKQAPSNLVRDLLSIGDVCLTIGDTARASECFTEAAEIARGMGNEAAVLSARCRRLAIDPGDAAECEAGYAEREDKLDLETRHYMLFDLWSATGNRDYLRQAKELLDLLVSRAPERYRESMLTRVQLHRGIERDWMSNSA